MTFEPHPRDYFAAVARKPELAPARIATLRDKLGELAAAASTSAWCCPSTPPGRAVAGGLHRRRAGAGLGVKYVLVGDDFRFGAKRAGDYAMLDAAGGPGLRCGPHEQLRGPRPARVQLGGARGAGPGAHGRRGALLGRPYSISGHVVHGRKLGANWAATAASGRASHPEPALCALEARCQRHLCGAGAWPGRTPAGVANLGIRPSLDPHDVNGGRVLLETHCLHWPATWAPRGRTVKSSAWNCCTNCTTN
jgi:riboflavin kinase/FMN adenylyltransferase